jgi:hypothetical protein
LKKLGFLFFALQTVCIVIFSLTNVRQIAATNGRGIPISWLVMGLCFFLLNLNLARKAMEEGGGGRESWFVVIAYALWSLGMAVSVMVFNFKTGGRVTGYDGQVLTIVGGCALAVTIAKLVKGWPWSDPTLQGFLSCIFVAIPQLGIVAEMNEHGGGPAIGTLLAGHAIVAIRFVQLGIAIYKEGFNREHRGIIFSETGNWLSWMAVTFVALSR